MLISKTTSPVYHPDSLWLSLRRPESLPLTILIIRPSLTQAKLEPLATHALYPPAYRAPFVILAP
jgi:hypothetical protein